MVQQLWQPEPEPEPEPGSEMNQQGQQVSAEQAERVQRSAETVD